MTFRPLIPALAVSVSFMAFAGTVGSASAQTALSGCDPATGLGQNGQPCVELTPLDPNRITNVAPGADGENQVLAVYSKVGWIAIGAGVLMMIAAPMITKYMHLDTLQDDNVEGNIEEKTA